MISGSVLIIQNMMEWMRTWRNTFCSIPSMRWNWYFCFVSIIKISKWWNDCFISFHTFLLYLFNFVYTLIWLFTLSCQIRLSGLSALNFIKWKRCFFMMLKNQDKFLFTLHTHLHEGEKWRKKMINEIYDRRCDVKRRKI